MNAATYVRELQALGFALQVVTENEKPMGLYTQFPVPMPSGQDHERWMALEAWRSANVSKAELCKALSDLNPSFSG